MSRLICSNWGGGGGGGGKKLNTILRSYVLLSWTYFNSYLASIIISVACQNNRTGTYWYRERSGSVVECLTRDRGAAGSSLISVTALWSLSKTHLS